MPSKEPEFNRPEEDFDWDHPLADVSAYEPAPRPENPEPPRPRTIRRGLRRAEGAALGSPTDRPPSDDYLAIELVREHVHSIDWEPAVSAPRPISRDALSAEQWSLIEGLFELRLLSRSQIHCEFLKSIGDRQLRRELSRLKLAGILQRGRLFGPTKYGRGEKIYVLGSRGFALLREAHDHPASGEWRSYLPRSAQYTVHDLIRNEWLFAFRSLAPRQLVDFRGTRRGKIKVPWVGVARGQKRPLKWADLRERPAVDLLSERFSNIVPDLTLELHLDEPGGERLETDLLVEIERRNNDEAVWHKALVYDGFLNGWWREHARYEAQGRPPMVVFAVPDLQQARRFITILDKALQGHQVVVPQTQTRAENELGVRPSATKLYFGRERTFVAVARDVHQRTMRAWRVPAEPPDQRVRMAVNAAMRREASRPIPRIAQLLDQRGLVDPAT